MSYYIRNQIFDFFGFDSLTKDNNKLPDEYVDFTVSPVLPVSLSDVKHHLRQDSSTDDDLITGLIYVAEKIGEDLSREVFTRKNFRTYRDKFERESILLKRRPVVTVDKLSYVTDEDGTYEDIDASNYYVTQAVGYSRVYRKDYYAWPQITINRKQAVRVEFTAGLAASEATMPEDIKTAIMQHVSVLYEQRGDWGSADINQSAIIGTLPSASKLIYAVRRAKVLNRGFID